MERRQRSFGNNDLSHDEIVQRRDKAVGRALNTPPKPLKSMKKKQSKKQQDNSLTASFVKHD